MRVMGADYELLFIESLFAVSASCPRLTTDFLVGAELTWSINAVITCNLGNLAENLSVPSGLEMRFRNKILSSGTPRSLSTSTAIVAEPPAADQHSITRHAANCPAVRLR